MVKLFVVIFWVIFGMKDIVDEVEGRVLENF